MGNAAPIRPQTTAELAESVRQALAAGTPLELRGLGGKRGIGRLSAPGRILDLSGFSGITDYDPAELVLTAGAGTPMREVQQALDAAGQMLAFEPPDYGRLLGNSAGGSSLGGVLSAGFGGPRRMQAGGPRDHFLGFQAVSGRGDLFRAGGKVVKNVTGYDLCKLVCGGWGTLAALCEVTVRTLPAPEVCHSLLLPAPDAGRAGRLMIRAVNSPQDVSGACWLSAAAAARCSPPLPGAGQGLVVLRLEGYRESVAARLDGIRRLLREDGLADDTAGILEDAASRAFWRDAGDAAPLAGPELADRAVWRISTAPGRGAAVVRGLAALTGGAPVMMDWGGGLVWAAVPATGDCGAAQVRQVITGADGGQGLLLRAPEAARATAAVFHPLPPALMTLNKRLKQAFDPGGLFNPGRIYPEF